MKLVFCLVIHFLFVSGQFEDELFGSGEFRKSKRKGTHLHLSSSTEDLISLFEAEKSCIEELKANYSSFTKEVQQNVDNYMKTIDFDESEGEEYVDHPINAFHLLQRTKNLKKLMSKINLKHLNLPSIQDFHVGATNGIADLQEFHGFNTKDLARGSVFDYKSQTYYQANSNMTSSEILEIATSARLAHYFDSYVEWLKAGLYAAKKEQKPQTVLNGIKKLIKKGKQDHDYIWSLYNFNASVSTGFRVALTPYFSNSLTKSHEMEFHRRKVLIENTFDNLLTNPLEEFSEHGQSFLLDIFLRHRIRDLCNGKFQRPQKISKDLNCIWLHHQDPYLRLAPFKLEYRHKNPQIVTIHDMASPKELNDIKAKARGHMVSTPYQVTTNSESLYSKKRTSKVMYMNELLVPEAMRLSKKISQIGRFDMKNERYSSENFQVMNYGIGGRISMHLDSIGGYNEDNSEADHCGGTRMTTFMIYLSDVKAGGHTLFPQAGIFVKPKAGDALFWYNHGTKSNYDSRINHLGCPVLYGNKWIANKWIKLLPQWKTYPSSIKEGNFNCAPLQ